MLKSPRAVFVQKLHQMDNVVTLYNGGDSMKIGIIGAGRVGCSIGKYLIEQKAECTIVGYYSRSPEKVADAAKFTHSKEFNNLNELVESSDTLFVTTPDDAIGDVWDCIDKKMIKDKVVCHFSGSLSSDVFKDSLEYQVISGSVHPMYAFSDKFNSYKQLNNVVFSVEGHPLFIEKMNGLFSACKNPVCVLEKENKVKYHAAASLVSNHMLGLLDICTTLLEEIGYDRENAYKVFAPLVKNNVISALDSSVEKALTGPIERGDENTVLKHLSCLEGYSKEVYGMLGKNVLNIARRKNPERDYSKLERILEI